jgi:hypothetical protein
MMRCQCGGPTKVTETRSESISESVILRKRQCLKCRGKFVTQEVMRFDDGEVLRAAVKTKTKVPPPATIDTPLTRTPTKRFPRVMKQPATPPASRNDREGLQKRAEARSRLEEMRDEQDFAIDIADDYGLGRNEWARERYGDE